MADYETESDHSDADSDIESLRLSDREDRLAAIVESPAPTNHSTAGRALRDGWFIKAKVPKEYIDRYLKLRLGPENSTIKSVYRLHAAVDELQLGLGKKSWNEGIASFSELYYVNEEKDMEDAERLEPHKAKERFFYRNPVDCVKYLLSQKCFTEDIVYAPVKE
ncbi:hypothetical protein HOY82DRAFT_542394 [Tuber indicum]|nr:hypothetical protein HOY82DRAFT_542394 [Tuber indicum]